MFGKDKFTIPEGPTNWRLTIFHLQIMPRKHTSVKTVNVDEPMGIAFECETLI